MNPTIQICLDLKRLHCTQPRPCSSRTMSVEANEKRKVTNVSGGMKFSPSFITGTLVPNRSPASIVAASPLLSTSMVCSARESTIMVLTEHWGHVLYLAAFLLYQSRVCFSPSLSDSTGLYLRIRFILLIKGLVLRGFDSSGV